MLRPIKVSRLPDWIWNGTECKRFSKADDRLLMLLGSKVQSMYVCSSICPKTSIHINYCISPPQSISHAYAKRLSFAYYVPSTNIAYLQSTAYIHTCICTQTSTDSDNLCMTPSKRLVGRPHHHNKTRAINQMICPNTVYKDAARHIAAFATTSSISSFPVQRRHKKVCGVIRARRSIKRFNISVCTRFFRCVLCLTMLFYAYDIRHVCANDDDADDVRSRLGDFQCLFVIKKKRPW